MTVRELRQLLFEVENQDAEVSFSDGAAEFNIKDARAFAKTSVKIGPLNTAVVTDLRDPNAYAIELFSRE